MVIKPKKSRPGPTGLWTGYDASVIKCLTLSFIHAMQFKWVCNDVRTAN